MKIDLRQYTVPSEYPAIYKHNFEQIDRIDDDQVLSGLVTRLAGISGIERKIVLLELKRYLMNSMEYCWSAPVAGGNIRRSIRSKVITRLFAVLFGMFRRTSKKIVEVVIDDFSEGVMDNLYGKELVNGVADNYKYMTMDFSKSLTIRPLLFLRYFFQIAGMNIYNQKIIRTHGMDLKVFINNYFIRLMSGKTLKHINSPKLIISGNDNGFPVIIAKAAGAELMLIQNAKKTLFSDATFKYADHFVSMGDIAYSGVLKATGCVFKNIYPFGSIRLYHYFSSRVPSLQKIEFDILWISDLEYNDTTEGTFGRYYSQKSEVEAIELLNRFAEESNLRIAYKCRTVDEMDCLTKMGLISKKIIYIGRMQKNTYEVVLRSNLILSTISSVVFEAMGIGGKGGYVNLSGNDNVNYDVRALDIEYNPKTMVSFGQFIDDLRTRSVDASKYIKQNPRFVPDLLAVIRRIVKG